MRGLPNKLKQHISDISHLDLIICIRINVFQLTKRRCSKEFITNYETGLAYLIMTLGFSTVTGSITLRLLPTSFTPFTRPSFEGDALLHSMICERLLWLKFPNFWEHAQGWYYREQGSRRLRTFALQQYVIFHIVWVLSHANESIHHTRSLSANVQLLNTLMIAQTCLKNERIL